MAQFTYYFVKNYSKLYMIGKKKVYLPTCQSTNTYLASLASQEGLSEGYLVYTFEQTAGKGQRGNVWHSEPQKNLTFSYLLFPTMLPLADVFLLSMVTALGIYDFLAKYVSADELHIKYPNDMLVGKQKIGGILIENSLRGEQIERSVVGIGLNINQTAFQYPRSTSLLLQKNITGIFDLETCLQELIVCLDLWYEMLKEKKYIEIKANFLAKSFQFNELCTYYTPEGEIYGKIIDVDTAGVLHIETKTGLKTFHFKEISFFPL